MNMMTDAAHVASHEAARAAVHAGGEFLTFRLGAEEYGIDILKVQEIRSYEQPTRIANAPSFIKGVVNLRGVIVPIVDLRIKLGCDTTVKLLYSAVDTSFITGIGSVGERMLILMDIEGLMASAEMGLINELH